MGRASELAAELRARESENAAAGKAALDVYSVISDHADDLWEVFVAGTVNGIEEFAGAWQAAKNSCLSAKRLNANSLIISTIIVPRLKLDILYIPKRCISYRTTEQFTACALPEVGSSGEFRFTADRQMQPYFTDGKRYLVPQEAADILIDLVGDFFKKAQALPSILS